MNKYNQGQKFYEKDENDNKRKRKMIYSDGSIEMEIINN